MSGTPTVIPLSGKAVLHLPPRSPELHSSKGNLAEEIWISDISRPDHLRGRQDKKNIYLCLSISARVPFGYWKHEPIVGQKLALISLAGLC